MATSLSTNTTVNSEKIELSLSIVGATDTNSGKTVASPDGACNTPTSTPDSDSPATTDFDAPTSDEETSGTEDSDSSDSSVEQPEDTRTLPSAKDMTTDTEANKPSSEFDEDSLVLQIINEIRNNGLQPRGTISSRMATTKSDTKLMRRNSTLSEAKLPTDGKKTKEKKRSKTTSDETKDQGKAPGKK